MDAFEQLSKSLEGLLMPQKVTPTEDDPTKMWQMIEQSNIRYSDEVKKPPVILSISEGGKHIPVFTLGNISLLKGPAKSRKTFGLSMFTCALSYNMPVYGKFIPSMYGKMCVYVDTEQADYHVHRFISSVVNISMNTGQSPTFWTLALRRYETQMRLKIVEFLVYNVKNLGYLVIDGIRDLIVDFNSIQETKMIVDKLLKWSKERNIHISVVLHENPGSEKARGHIGTELVNKAETVIRFEKDKEDPTLSVISPSETRGEEFQPIYFKIAQCPTGYYPEIVDTPVYQTKTKGL